MFDIEPQGPLPLIEWTDQRIGRFPLIQNPTFGQLELEPGSLGQMQPLEVLRVTADDGKGLMSQSISVQRNETRGEGETTFGLTATLTAQTGSSEVVLTTAESECPALVAIYKLVNNSFWLSPVQAGGPEQGGVPGTLQLMPGLDDAEYQVRYRVLHDPSRPGVVSIEAGSETVVAAYAQAAFASLERCWSIGPTNP